MNDLKEYFQKRKHRDEQREINAEEMLPEWKAAVDKLFAQFVAWLSPTKEVGVEITQYNSPINEYALGSYELPALQIKFQGSVVNIRPVARIVVNGAGRVDVDSAIGQVPLIRSSEDGGEWFILRDKDAVLLDEESFSKLIKEMFV